MALLLQLVLPFIGLPRAEAGPGAPFVVCTGAGLVWVNADGTPVERGEARAWFCPVCAIHHAAHAILPTAPALAPPAVAAPVDAPRRPAARRAWNVGPPLAARGPPAGRALCTTSTDLPLEP